MAKLSLTDLANLQNETTAVNAINANNELVEAAVENTLSRDGTTPNQMGAVLDMNSNAIINLPTPVTGDAPLRLQDYNTLLSGGTISVNTSAGVEFIMDGSGATIGTGIKGYLQVPFGATITKVDLLADTTGSVVVDIWKSSYTNFNPTTYPTSAQSITASALPTITASNKYEDSTLTGWTKSIGNGDVLAFVVNSCSSITKLAVCLTMTKT